MKRLPLAAVCAIILALMVAPAQARHYKHKRIHYYSQGQIVAHPQGCPSRAFCGCAASVRIFGKPIRSLYLASAWFKFPHASPGPGMVAVRNHHVMVILEPRDGNAALVYDGNSGGHKTRIHMRSLAGYRIVNPHGSRYASM